MSSRVFLVGITLIGSALLFSACIGSRSTPASTGSSGTVEQKVGDTVKTGLISESNGVFMLTVTGQPPVEIDSYSVDLKEYVGKTVTVTGQYSGDTLFVGKVE